MEPSAHSSRCTSTSQQAEQEPIIVIISESDDDNEEDTATSSVDLAECGNLTNDWNSCLLVIKPDRNDMTGCLHTGVGGRVTPGRKVAVLEQHPTICEILNQTKSETVPHISSNGFVSIDVDKEAAVESADNPGVRKENPPVRSSCNERGEGTQIHVCEICHLRCKDSHDLRIHMKVHKLEKLYVCHFCSREYRYPESLKVHMRIHTGERPFVCPTCDEGFVMPDQLKKHMLVHGHKLKCPRCRKCFMHKKKLEEHMETHKDVVCAICHKTFASADQLNVHMETHAKEQQNLKTCTTCNVKFESPEMLTMHMESHKQLPVSARCSEPPIIGHDVDSLSCPSCYKEFLDGEKLQSHLAARSFQCPICKKTFGDCLQRKVHLSKPHSYAEFKQLDKLKKHTPVKLTHKCPKCVLWFRDYSSLERHKRVYHK